MSNKRARGFFEFSRENSSSAMMMMMATRRCATVGPRFGYFLRALSTTEGAPSEKFAYRAETKSLLKIVSSALYTEREVFLRELVSNSCDALEKVRLKQQQEDDGDTGPLEIQIDVDKENKLLTVTDTGVGMSKEELVENLGTIALSGSKKFAEDTPVADIIGKFGVGFYSAFMVGDRVEVMSRGNKWSSNLEDDFEISPCDFTGDRGTRVVIHCKDDEYLNEDRLVDVVKKYSKFAQFPIKVGKNEVNTEALWTKKDATDAEKKAFYRSVFKAWDDPSYVAQFNAEAPIDLKALFFFPSTHTEKMGLGRLEPSVSLYCKKVMIENPCLDIVPDWMRFVKGVVDSEDLPLSISREKSQDKLILTKIQDILVRKTVRFLLDKMKNDREKYLTWYNEFSTFLKEGTCQDSNRRSDIAKLLFFDTSRGDDRTTLDEYVARGGDAIYYLQAPSKELAYASPYYEVFKRDKVECLFVYNTLDDFVMTNLKTYNGRSIKTAESYQPVSAAKDKKDAKKSGKEADSSSSSNESDKEVTTDLTKWIADTLGPSRIASCSLTDKLTDSPAIVEESGSAGSMRRMLLLLNQSIEQKETVPPVPPQKLLINKNHPIIKALDEKVHVTKDTAIAKLAVAQLFDNALVAAGLMDDARIMLKNLNRLLELAIHTSSKVPEEEFAAPPKEAEEESKGTEEKTTA